MVHRCTSRSSSGSSGSRRTSAARPPRRRGRCCASRRPARARRRPSSRGSRGWWTAGSGPARSPSSPSTSAPPRSSPRRLDAALEPLGVAAAAVSRPDVPRAGSRDARRGRGLDRPAHRPRRAAARAVPRGHRGGPRAPRSRVLTPQARPPGHGRRDRRRPGAWPRRARVRGLRAGDRCVGRRRLRRPRRSRTAPAPGRRGGARPLAGSLRGSSSSTRRRTSTGPSSSSRCSSRRPTTGVFLVGDDDQTIYWLEACRRAAGAGSRGVAAGPPARRPHDELPLPAPGRGAGRPARRAQSRAVRQADRGRAERGRAA